ncbi:MAG: type II toxin-antitoxin system VapC family toxin [Terracidiphilus sp.]
MIVYADSSFLVSSYTADAHSNEADNRRALSPTILITPFVRAELCTALHLQVFQKRVSLAQANSAWQDFEQDGNNGTLTRIDFPLAALPRTVDLAKRFAPTLSVRTLDSLHVACAMELKAQKFWTFDDRQARLAEAVGLDTTA